MAEPLSHTLDEFEKLFGTGSRGLVTQPAPEEAPPGTVPPLPASRSHTLDEFDKIAPGRWVPQEPQEKATESGYLAMQPAVAGRIAAGLFGEPIDLYNRFARFSNEQYGTGLPAKPASESAVTKLEHKLGVDRYKPTDSFEKAMYDAETAGAAALAPYGAGWIARGIGAGAKAAGLPSVGRKLTATGEALTYGGPITAASTATGAELIGLAAGASAPEGAQEEARELGTMGGGLVIGGALAPIKYGISRIAEPIRDTERMAARILNEKLGRPAATVLEGTPGPPVMGEMTRTAEELLTARTGAPGSGNTGIAALDKFARENASKDEFGRTAYDIATENRNVNRLGTVELGTDLGGAATHDPAIALGVRQSSLSNPSLYETDLQRQAQAAAAALPTRVGPDVEQSIGATLNRRYNDALDAQINKVAEVNKLVTGLQTKGKPGALILDFKNSVEERDPITRAGTGILNERKYNIWMDKNKHLLTPPQFARLSNIRTAQEELKNFNAQTKDLAAQFPVTPGGSYAGIADRYVPTKEGTLGGSRAVKYRELVKDDPAAMGDLFDYRMSQWRGDKDFLNADGSINHDTLTRLMKRDRAWLDEMPPHLTDKLTTARDAQALFDQTATLRTTALKDFENSSVKHLLGMRDPMKGMDDLLTKGNPINNVREVMRELRGHPSAQNGLRRNFIDYGGEKYFITTDAAGNQTFNPQGFKRFFDEHGDTVKVLYGKPGHDLLKKVYDDIGSHAASEARAARASAGMPERMAEGIVGKAFEKATHFVASKLGWPVGTLGYYMIAGAEPIGHGAIALAGGTAVVNNMIRSAQRRGVQNVTDRIAELLNNPKAAALAMSRVPDDPNHPILKRFISTLANAGTGIAVERATEEPYGPEGAPSFITVPGDKLRRGLDVITPKTREEILR